MQSTDEARHIDNCGDEDDLMGRGDVFIKAGLGLIVLLVVVFGMVLLNGCAPAVEPFITTVIPAK